MLGSTYRREGMRMFRRLFIGATICAAAAALLVPAEAGATSVLPSVSLPAVTSAGTIHADTVSTVQQIGQAHAVVGGAPSSDKRGALNAGTAAYSFSTLTVSMTPAQYTDPVTDPNWHITSHLPSSVVGTFFAVGVFSGPSLSDGIAIAVVAWNGSGFVPLLFNKLQQPIACPGMTFNLGLASHQYQVSIPAKCVGSPARLYWAGELNYNTDAAHPSLNSQLQDNVPQAAPPLGLLPTGYWLFATDGGVFPIGGAPFYGSLGNRHLNQPIVAGAASPGGTGYWMAASDGGIFQFGKAGFFGSLGNIYLNQPIVSMAPTATGKGYYLFARDGGVFQFGDAKYFGSLGNRHLNQPIVGAAVLPNDTGYWLFAADGGVFQFGKAAYHGSLGSIHLNQPIVAGTADQTGGGYWMVGADGGIFKFGDAPFLGSAVPLHPGPIADIKPALGSGYRIVSQTGQVFAFGAMFAGQVFPAHLNQPVVAFASIG